VALRRAARIASDSCGRTRCEPSGSVAITVAGNDFFPFFTRQTRCAPVATARRQRSMEKKLRSQKLIVPGCRVVTIWSHNACSLRV
jgi:hypothetical protein